MNRKEEKLNQFLIEFIGGKMVAVEGHFTLKELGLEMATNKFMLLTYAKSDKEILVNLRNVANVLPMDED